MSTTAGSSDVVLYEGARLIVGDGEWVVDNASLVVRDGLIEQVGPAEDIAAAPGQRTVSLRGKTVIPALVNPHGHAGYMRGTTSRAEYFSRENVLDHLRRLAYYGISVFQSLGTDRDDTEIRLRDDQRAGKINEVDVATLFTAGAGIVAPPNPDSANGGPFFAADTVHEATSPEDARNYVRELAAKKVDAVKFWLDDRNGTTTKLSPEIYQAIIDESHANNLKVAAHIYTLDEAKEVVRAGADILAHLPRQPGADEELIELLTARDVVVFTSMGIQRPLDEEWLGDPALAETVPAAAIADLQARIRARAPEPLFDTSESYGRMEKTLGVLFRASVRLVFSADTGVFAQVPGFAEHHELEALVAAGLPPLATLQIATQRSSELLGLTDRGTLEAGKRADFVILNADPLQDITNTRKIEAVYFGGRRIDRDRLRERWQNAA